MCPYEHRHCLGVSEAVWDRFSSFQKFLWWIDEVECRWQTWLELPELNATTFTEIDWIYDFKGALQAFGDFAGRLKPIDHARKKHSHVPSAYTLERNDRLVMAFDQDRKYHNATFMRQLHPNLYRRGVSENWHLLRVEIAKLRVHNHLLNIVTSVDVMAELLAKQMQQ